MVDNFKLIRSILSFDEIIREQHNAEKALKNNQDDNIEEN